MYMFTHVHTQGTAGRSNEACAQVGVADGVTPEKLEVFKKRMGEFEKSLAICKDDIEGSACEIQRVRELYEIRLAVGTEEADVSTRESARAREQFEKGLADCKDEAAALYELFESKVSGKNSINICIYIDRGSSVKVKRSFV